MTNLTKKLATVMYLGLLATALGCKEQGPLERAGEEIDEAVDTAKHGGKESTATKLDDAADEVRDGVKDASKDLKK